jgi:hypothetical protein
MANSFPQDLQITRVCRHVFLSATGASHSGQEMPGITLLNIMVSAFILIVLLKNRFFSGV